MNDASRPSRSMGMAEALRDAMRIAMRTDPTVFLLGEDIGVPGGFGGGFTVTLGLAEEFGRERVIDTPISEGAIVGAGSVITNPVPDKALALGRARQVVKEGWVKKS